MNRFAAWSMGKKLDDQAGRYRLIYGEQPTACAAEALRFVHLSVQDACYPPSKWDPRRSWDRFVYDNDLWMRDSAGGLIQGWGHHGNSRYVVDLGKEGPWAETVGLCEHIARTMCKASGLHLDDVSKRCFFSAAQGRHDRASYERNAYAIARVTTQPTSRSGWKLFYTPLAMLRAAGVGAFIKMEGFRFAPWAQGQGWSGPPEKPFTWYDWWSSPGSPGREGLYGIQHLEAAGLTPVIEAQYSETWDAETRERYAMIAVVTACLAERALVAVHEEYVWSDPYWSRAHNLALQLGEPIAPAKLRPKGTWARRFENGNVVMNPTDTDVRGVPPHSAAIRIGVEW